MLTESVTINVSYLRIVCLIFFVVQIAGVQLDLGNMENLLMQNNINPIDKFYEAQRFLKQNLHEDLSVPVCTYKDV